MSNENKKEDLFRQLLELMKEDESTPEKIRIPLLCMDAACNIINTLKPYGPIHSYMKLSMNEEDAEKLLPVRKQLYTLLNEVSADLHEFLLNHPTAEEILAE